MSLVVLVDPRPDDLMPTLGPCDTRSMALAWLRISLVPLAAAIGIPACADEPSHVGAGSELATISPRSATPGEWLVSCGSEGYPPAALLGPVGAEAADTEAAAALRALLANPVEIESVPAATGWRLLYEDEDTAVFGAGDPGNPDHEGGFAEVSFRRKTDGGPFEYGGSSHSCTPSVVVSGRNLVEFDLAVPAPPSPDAVRVEVLVTERACTNGAPIGDRLLPPEVRYRETSVEVLFTARPLEGHTFTCPGISPERAVLELDEAIGTRRLLDASRYPPRDPTQPRPNGLPPTDAPR